MRRGESIESVETHLKRCAACARFAERLRMARGLFREAQCEAEPDVHFANRVAARLSVEPSARLGWAAGRLLPATLALLLVLAWLSWQSAPETESWVAASPTEDLLTWVLDQAGEDR
jgi:hypothetical protein